MDAIQNLRSQLDIIAKRCVFIESKIENITKTVRSDPSNKSKCLLLLQSKKNMEAELQKNYGIQSIMENQLAALESSIINRQMVKAMEAGNRVIKDAQSDTMVEKLDELMDDIKEQDQIKTTISDLFSQSTNDIYTDDDLLAEFNTYLEEVEEEAKETVRPMYLPDVPTAPILIGRNITEEEQCIRKLQASMI